MSVSVGIYLLMIRRFRLIVLDNSNLIRELTFIVVKKLGIAHLNWL